VNFYISLEKRKKIAISLQQYDRSPQNLARVKCAAHQNVILKIQDGGRPIRLRDQFYVIMKYYNLSIFEMAAVRHF